MLALHGHICQLIYGLIPTQPLIISLVKVRFQYSGLNLIFDPSPPFVKPYQ